MDFRNDLGTGPPKPPKSGGNVDLGMESEKIPKGGREASLRTESPKKTKNREMWI